MVELKCPNCAKIAPAFECPRCGADLSALFVLQQTAADEIQRAAALGRVARPTVVSSLASRFWHRRHSPEAAKLAFIAALTTANLPSASDWFVRAQAPA